MQGRMYAVPWTFEDISEVCDAFELVAPATGIIALTGLKLAQTDVLTDANEVIVEVAIKRAAGAYTSGTGGAAATPVPMNQGDVAASATAEVGNNTAQALAGSGTLTTIDQDSWNVRSPFLWLPPERLWIVAHPTDAIIVSIETDPGTNVNMGGTAYIEEIGT